MTLVVDRIAQFQADLDEQQATIDALDGEVGTRRMVVTNDQETLTALLEVENPFGDGTTWTIPDDDLPATIRLDPLSDRVYLRRAGAQHKVTPGTTGSFLLRATNGGDVLTLTILISFLATAAGSPYIATDGFHRADGLLAGDTTETGDLAYTISDGTPAITDNTVSGNTQFTGFGFTDLLDDDTIHFEITADNQGSVYMLFDAVGGDRHLIEFSADTGAVTFVTTVNGVAVDYGNVVAGGLGGRHVFTGIYQRSQQRLFAYRDGVFVTTAIWAGIPPGGTFQGVLLRETDTLLEQFNVYDPDITAGLLTYDPNDPFNIPVPAIAMPDVYVLPSATSVDIYAQAVMPDGTPSPRSWAVKAQTLNASGTGTQGSIDKPLAYLMPCQESKQKWTIPLSGLANGYSFDFKLFQCPDTANGATIVDTTCKVRVVTSLPAGYSQESWTPPALPSLPSVFGEAPDVLDDSYTDFMANWTKQGGEINAAEGLWMLPGTLTVSGATPASPYESGTGGRLLMRPVDARSDNLVATATGAHPSGHWKWGAASITRTFSEANVEYFLLDARHYPRGPAVSSTWWGYDNTNAQPTEEDGHESLGGNSDGQYAIRAINYTLHLNTFPGPDNKHSWTAWGDPQIRHQEYVMFNRLTGLWRVWLDGTLVFEHLYYPMKTKRFNRILCQELASTASGGSYDNSYNYAADTTEIWSHAYWGRTAA